MIRPGRLSQRKRIGVGNHVARAKSIGSCDCLRNRLQRATHGRQDSQSQPRRRIWRHPHLSRSDLVARRRYPDVCGLPPRKRSIPRRHAGSRCAPCRVSGALGKRRNARRVPDGACSAAKGYGFARRRSRPPSIAISKTNYIFSRTEICELHSLIASIQDEELMHLHHAEEQLERRPGGSRLPTPSSRRRPTRSSGSRPGEIGQRTCRPREQP